jgi:hypothetical protein
MKDTTYNFHQTPVKLAIDLIKEIPLVDNDIVLEPFKGEGAFYDNFPNNITKEWCEIEEGRDFKSHTENVDWVISNPPFKLENNGHGKNGFFQILEHFSTRINKGIAFLGNDYCFASLTPKRMKQINDNGLYLNKVVVCNIKQWRGRYFFMVFEKTNKNVFHYLQTSYSKE